MHFRTNLTNVLSAKLLQSCPTFCDPMDCSPPGSSVHGILKARILEWVAISFSRGSSDPGIEPRSPALQANSLPTELWGKPWCEMLGWMKPKLESRLPGKISVISDMQMTPPLWQKAKRNWRASWWKWKSKVKKLAYSSIFRELRSWHPVPSLHGK